MVGTILECVVVALAIFKKDYHGIFQLPMGLQHAKCKLSFFPSSLLFWEREEEGMEWNYENSLQDTLLLGLQLENTRECLCSNKQVYCFICNFSHALHCPFIYIAFGVYVLEAGCFNYSNCLKADSFLGLWFASWIVWPEYAAWHNINSQWKIYIAIW